MTIRGMTCVLLLSVSSNIARAASSSAKKASADAIVPITKDGYPDVYAAWGDAGIRRINALMPKAAQKAAESPECDLVEYVGYSERSTPRKAVVLYVDCKNRKRFFLSEADILAKAVARSKEGKTARYSDETALRACEDDVKGRMTYPLTFKRRWTATSVYRAPGGNIVVEFVFDAKNRLGAELPHKARCVIDDQGMRPAEITVR